MSQLVKVTLSKDAGPHKRGSTVEVDEKRAAQWAKDGFTEKKKGAK